MKRLTNVTGVVLAGGRGNRMGGEDKGLLLLHGKPLYEHVIEKLRLQVVNIVISANRNLDTYRQKGFPVIGDVLPDFPGPLAGMLSVMQATTAEWFLFCPCDTPNIPQNLAARLWNDRRNSPAVWVNDGERDHPGIALVQRTLMAPLQDYLLSGERRVMQFLKSIGGHSVSFNREMKCFTNINTPDDLARCMEK